MHILFIRRLFSTFLYGCTAGIILLWFSHYIVISFCSPLFKNGIYKPITKTFWTIREYEVKNKNLSPSSIESIDTFKETNDRLVYKDKNDTLTGELFKQVRVLCWIMTQPQNLNIRAVPVNSTWAKRCNKVLFASDYKNDSFPTIDIKVQPGRDHLTEKTMKTFDFIYANHLKDADWFLKADDDTYVIMENLRYLLHSHSPDEPVYFGHLFGLHVKQGYFSGGAGYVLSKEALKRFGARETGKCNDKYIAEDVEMGRCLESLGIITGDTRDSRNKSRFHPLSLKTHLNGEYPDWFKGSNKYDQTGGASGISNYPISFHYVTPENMYMIEFFVYHVQPYGAQSNKLD